MSIIYDNIKNMLFMQIKCCCDSSSYHHYNSSISFFLYISFISFNRLLLAYIRVWILLNINVFKKS